MTIKGNKWKKRKGNKLSHLESEVLKMNWKFIILGGIITRYLINESGNIISLKYEQLLSPSVNTCGYYMVIIFAHNDIDKSFKEYNCSLARLVAQTFISNPDNKPYINHKDGNKLNNHVSNLEWVTPSENTKHAYDIGLMTVKQRSGENNGSHIYKNNQIHKVCQMIKNGYKAKEISLVTKVSVDTIWQIKAKSAWTSISKEYNLPDPKPREEPFEIKYGNIVNEMINKGMCTNDILTSSGLPSTDGARTFVNRTRRKLLSASTTIENSNIE